MNDLTAMALTLHFDGSCNPNPGGVARYGWHLEVGRAGGAEPLAEGAGPVEGAPTSSNLAEWSALAAGLRWLAHLTLPVDALEIVGDSRLVIEQLNGRWKCEAAHLRLLRDECRRLLGRPGCGWSARWAPRRENARANALAGCGR